MSFFSFSSSLNGNDSASDGGGGRDGGGGDGGVGGGGDSFHIALSLEGVWLCRVYRLACGESARLLLSNLSFN